MCLCLCVREFVVMPYVYLHNPYAYGCVQCCLIFCFGRIWGGGGESRMVWLSHIIATYFVYMHSISVFYCCCCCWCCWWWCHWYWSCVCVVTYLWFDFSECFCVKWVEYIKRLKMNVKMPATATITATTIVGIHQRITIIM